MDTKSQPAEDSKGTSILEGYAVPLIAPDGGGNFHGATGFLARVLDRTYLVTAAHFPIGKSHPTPDWALWPSTMSIGRPAQGGKVVYTDLDLFTTGVFGQRVPVFQFLRHDDGRDLADILLFPCSNASRWSDVFSVIDAGPSAPCLLGEVLTLVGFPLDLDPWPQTEEVSGPFFGVNGQMLEANLVPREGYSGCPVFGQDRQFVGMAIGTDTNDPPRARIVPRGMLRVAAVTVDGRLPSPRHVIQLW